MSRQWRTRILAHLEMTRPYTMFHSGLVALAGAVVASRGQASRRNMVLAVATTTLGWVAGLYAGDYYDRELDALSKPYRPIPSGRVPAREAFTTMCLYIGLGYLCALVLSVANLTLAVGTTVLGIAYARTFKGRALMGNLDRGVLGALAVLFGALASQRRPGALDDQHRQQPEEQQVQWISICLLATLILCHDASTNLVGALRDVEGDRAAGCRTVPVVYGLCRAAAIACLFALCSTLLTMMLLWRLWARRPLGLALYGASLTLTLRVYGRLWWRRQTLSRADALDMHKILVIERLLLVSGIIGMVLPAQTTLTVLGSVLGATTAAQAALRDRYEGMVAAPEDGKNIDDEQQE